MANRPIPSSGGSWNWDDPDLQNRVRDALWTARERLLAIGRPEELRRIVQIMDHLRDYTRRGTNGQTYATEARDWVNDLIAANMPEINRRLQRIHHFQQEAVIVGLDRRDEHELVDLVREYELRCPIESTIRLATRHADGLRRQILQEPLPQVLRGPLAHTYELEAPDVLHAWTRDEREAAQGLMMLGRGDDGPASQESRPPAQPEPHTVTLTVTPGTASPYTNGELFGHGPRSPPAVNTIVNYDASQQAVMLSNGAFRFVKVVDASLQEQEISAQARNAREAVPFQNAYVPPRGVRPLADPPAEASSEKAKKSKSKSKRKATDNADDGGPKRRKKVPAASPPLADVRRSTRNGAGSRTLPDFLTNPFAGPQAPSSPPEETQPARAARIQFGPTDTGTNDDARPAYELDEEYQARINAPINDPLSFGIHPTSFTPLAPLPLIAAQPPPVAAPATQVAQPTVTAPAPAGPLPVWAQYAPLAPGHQAGDDNTDLEDASLWHGSNYLIQLPSVIRVRTGSNGWLYYLLRCHVCGGNMASGNNKIIAGSGGLRKHINQKHRKGFGIGDITAAEVMARCAHPLSEQQARTYATRGQQEEQNRFLEATERGKPNLLHEEQIRTALNAGQVPPTFAAGNTSDPTGVAPQPTAVATAATTAAPAVAAPAVAVPAVLAPAISAPVTHAAAAAALVANVASSAGTSAGGSDSATAAGNASAGGWTAINNANQGSDDAESTDEEL